MRRDLPQRHKDTKKLLERVIGARTSLSAERAQPAKSVDHLLQSRKDNFRASRSCGQGCPRPNSAHQAAQPRAQVWRTTLSHSVSQPNISAMRLPFETFMVVILVSLTACARVTNQSNSNDHPPRSASTPTPATETQLQKPTQAQSIQKRWKNIFAVKTHSISEKHEGYCPYEISAEYPEAISRKPAVKKFNKWIKRKILADVKRFRWLELRAEPRAKKEGRKSLTEGLGLFFEIYFANERLISLRLTHQVMAAGQMHPIDYYETINYDLRKQRSLVARDVFRRGYLKVFSSYSRKYLTDTYEISNDDWLNEGTRARRYNFENWTLVPDGVLISFEDYQVSSHSFGQPELIIPYSRLRRVLRTRGFARP
jgi:hypothetical protein